MKQFKTLLIIAILCLVATQISNAQTKVAHVDTNEIISKFPAIVEAQKQLEQLNTTYEAEIKKMIEEYQVKLKKYEEESLKVSEAVKIDRQKEVQDIQKRIGDFRDNAQKELQKKNDETIKPLIDKIKNSIQKIGKTKGFKYVIDSSTLLLADGTNLTADVKRDLGF